MELSAFIDSLDLNAYEKEIILYLAKVDAAIAKKIYNNTKVPQGRIYSVLEELKRKSIVDCIPTSPKRYQIKNVKNALRQYINSKKSELDKKNSEIDGLETTPKEFTLENKNISVNLFTGRDEHLNALTYFRSSASKNILQIAPLFEEKWSSMMSIIHALQRGIKFRILIKNITPKNKKNVETCVNYGADVRIYNSKDMLSMIIKDNLEFLIGVQDYKKEEERLTLFSKNKAVLDVLMNTFEDCWKKSEKINIKRISKK